VGVNGLGTLTVTKTLSGSNFNYTKAVEAYDYAKQDGSIDWKIVISSDIPDASGIVDTLTEANASVCSAQHGCSYYTKDQIDSIVVKSGDTTLVKDEDYEIIEYTWHNDDGTDSTGEKRYSGFKLKFLHAISASSTNQVTLQYTSHLDMKTVHQIHNGGTIDAYNRSVFTYHIGTDNANGELEKNAYVAYAPNGQAVEKNYVGYDASTGELVWYIRANIQSDVSGRAYITEYIPAGQTYSSANIIVAEKGAWFPKALYWVDENQNSHLVDKNSGPEAMLWNKMDASGNNSAISTYAYSGIWTYTSDNGVVKSKITIDYKNITQEDWADENGTVLGQKVTIPLDNVQGCGNNNQGATSGGWNNYGRFTIRVKTKLDADELVYLASGANKAYSNTATFTQPDHLVYGDTTTAKGTVSNGSKIVTKEMATKENPAYVQYALDVNANAYDLMAGNEPLTVIDVMQTGLTLATGHSITAADGTETPQYFDVYDVTSVEDQIYKADGTTLDASKVRSLGTAVTDECTITDVTGDTTVVSAADKDKPAYKITVPDGKHIVVLYWAATAAMPEKRQQ
jgi:hypothetical protein